MQKPRASLSRLRFSAWLPAIASQNGFIKSVAAVRSTGLRLLHFSAPKDIGAVGPAGIPSYYYKIVMIIKLNLSVGFGLGQRRYPL